MFRHGDAALAYEANNTHSVNGSSRFAFSRALTRLIEPPTKLRDIKSLLGSPSRNDGLINLNTAEHYDRVSYDVVQSTP